MYQDKFVNKWVTEIKTQMAGICEENFVIPVIALFYNNAATGKILESKCRLRRNLAVVEQQYQEVKRLPWYSVLKRLVVFIKSRQAYLAVLFGVWRHQPPKEAIDRCISSPEFEFLKYLHKLTERMAAWRSFADKHLPSELLPKEFVDVKGHLDAPLSAYDSLCQVQEMADAFIPADMQRTMFAVMLSEMMVPSKQRAPPHAQYAAIAAV
jgi:hypothetical protein